MEKSKYVNKFLKYLNPWWRLEIWLKYLETTHLLFKAVLLRTSLPLFILSKLILKVYPIYHPSKNKIYNTKLVILTLFSTKNIQLKKSQLFNGILIWIQHQPKRNRVFLYSAIKLELWINLSLNPLRTA